MAAPIVPWSFLIDAEPRPKDPAQTVNPKAPKQQKSFIDAVNNVCDIPLSQLPIPCVKGDNYAISIPEDEYQQGVETCKHHLHGRAIWTKGSTPLTVAALKNRLSSLWKSIGRWGITSLGKGYYEFTFSSLEDVRRVRSVNSWNINSGFLKLFPWCTDFNPNSLKQTSAQVWVRIHGLSQEYWRPKIIFAIASSIGTPLCTDSATNKDSFDRPFGHFARVLVDMEIASELRYKILVERKGFAFFVELEYEHLPDYCSFCKCIGHHIDNCKRRDSDQVDKDVKKKTRPEPKQAFVQVTDKNKGIAIEVVELEDSAAIIANNNKDSGVENIAPLKVDSLQINQTTGETSGVRPSMNTISVVADTVVEEDGIENNDTHEKHFDGASISSIESEFVDDTQLKVSDFGTEGNVIQQIANIPVEVQKDMEFLKTSWANMAELDAEDDTTPLVDGQQILEAIPDAKQHDDGFQMVLSKSKKKNPEIVDFDDQQVSFLLKDNDRQYGMSAIYASTNYIHRRNLWQALHRIQSQFNLPWSFIGDYNIILGAHEHRGAYLPARLPMDDFIQWTDSNQLIHLPTSGALFTWANGRGGRNYTEKRLDRTVCNHQWIDMWDSVSCRTLIKNRSDHYPLLFDFQMKSAKFASQFRFMQMWSLHPECKDVISSTWSSQVVGCPMFILSKKLQLLKAKLKDWNKSKFGNVQDNVKMAEDTLKKIQMQIEENGHSDVLSTQERNAKINLDAALQIEEVFWKEKARDNGLIEEVIPNLVDDHANNLLTTIPTHEEIFSAVKSLSKDSAPGPDGFGGFFFQTYWDIINHDVVNAVTQFFTDAWILPNYNSNTLVLIPKTSNADSIDQYRPIALANFKHKIITKVLADRLAIVLPSIISQEQRAFIHGRKIADCICLTSEVVNLLHNKSFGGNVALKVDISKAFDTLNWQFLLKVLGAFGFNENFCQWIKVILHSASLSVSINGKQRGFFSCNRGVRQGDPLSPLLFCIAEDVLSRGLTKLVSDQKIKLIKGTRNFMVPSHILYADDIMVFCKGNANSINEVANLFLRYANCSGQSINPSKSIVYAGSMTAQRHNQIANLLGFSVGFLPFLYLGVPMFKGKPKTSHFQFIVDKIRLKLASWKASLLSIAGRIQLVKSVIQSMLMHCLLIYSWPASLTNILEKWIRNFIWSGDIDKRKLVTVAWHNCCKSFSDGGLGIRSIKILNEASNIKQCWDLVNSQDHWARLLRSRVLRNGRQISHHIFSSLWSGLKGVYEDFKHHSSWLLGNGGNINFWLDNWCGQPLVHSLNIPDWIHPHLKSTVKAFIVNHQWSIPQALQLAFPNLSNIVQNITIPLGEVEDKTVWDLNELAFRV
ncbi:hypothetical protein TSUD_133200 [Trifolium subterraneum]|uniref:Reverse transcriptase domain-containing protein n=1 Tax=Trifolium subterraneum TaxID=3900 RepID=A0A2Z6PCW3_TRISU|nr:hypothetical protein TSUD_133200 [Trifolium subterraneum]